MLAIINKFDSGTIKALIAATLPLLGLIATLFGVDQALFDQVADTWVQILLALLTAGGVAWAAWARLFQPTPPLTESALLKTSELVRTGAIKTVNGPVRQGGFFRPALVLWLALASFGGAVVVLPGCVHTKEAYEAARATENAVADTAFVVAEHYAAVLHEAADLAEVPTTPDSVKNAMKAADKVVKPLILGDPVTGRPGLRTLAARYTAVKSAENQADLQAAINDAVVELAKLINAVKTARGNP